MKICQICKSPLQTGNPVIRRHLFPERFKKYFSKSQIQKIFQIDDASTIGEFCYGCHEEILQNVVLNKKIIDNLSALFVNKDKRTRIKLLHQAFKKGISLYLKNLKKKKSVK